MPPTQFDSDQERTVVTSVRDGASMQPGDKILNDTYVIERLLGKGGMGEVYQAEHIELGSKRAIKIVSPEFARDSQYIGLFIEEARKLSRVNHDAIVRYYEFSRGESGARYLVMEYVAGDSLAAVLENHRLEPPDVLKLLQRLAHGLAAAYDQGIKAHRDVSPANILLPEGRVELAKVIDFGIAKSADPAGGTLIGSDFAGKYSFVSPEQAGLFGGQQEVNEKSDIYSLGLLLAAAAIGFGKRLDMGNEPLSVVRARQNVPDLGRIPAELRPLLTTMLQPHPQDRPASMRALAADADRLLLAPAIAIPAAAPGQPPARRRTRWPLVAGAAGSGLAVLVAAFFLWTQAEKVPAGPPEPPPKPAVSSTPTVVAPPLPPPALPQPTMPEPAQPSTHAVLTPPPMPPKPADPQAELTAAIAQLDCAAVRTAAAANGRSLIAGTVSSARDQAKLLAAAARIAEPQRPRFDLEIVLPPVCGTLKALQDWQRAGLVAAGGIDVKLADGAGLLHENDPIAIAVASRRDYPVNLRIDYFTLGGQVLHMWPNTEMPEATLAAGAAREFLKSGPGSKVWRVGGAPFGTELIAVTATLSPLDFGAALPTIENADDYLRELKRALQQAASAAQPPLAATVLVHTAEK